MIPNTHAIHFVAKANAGSVITTKNSQFEAQEACTEFLLSPTLVEQTPSIPRTPAADPVELDFPITVHSEQYYVVDYLRAFYIGRALENVSDSTMNFKFLNRSLVANISTFYWPRRNDINTCHSKIAFYGPIQLVGTGPFTVLGLESMKKAFASLTKRH